MFDLFHLFLFFHIGGAIIAFGPAFTYPIIGAMGGKDPAHVGFATRLTYRLAHGVTLPGAILVGLMGLGAALTGSFNLLSLWLALAIVLYVIALSISIFIATPNAHKLMEATQNPPPPPPAGAPRPSGPPPHIAAMVKTSQQAGMALLGLVTAIFFLMVFKPGA